MRVVAIVLPSLALEVTKVAPSHGHEVTKVALGGGHGHEVTKGARGGGHGPGLGPVGLRAAANAPRAVVLASRDDMDESSLTGNVRLHAVCPRARNVGIFPGQTIAAARAREASLSVGLVTEEALVRALERIAEASLAFGATVAFARGVAGDDTVWVDVTGCAHLFADSPRSLASFDDEEPSYAARGEAAAREGEPRLLARLGAMVAGLGHEHALALAGGPKIARALALSMVTGTTGSRSLSLVVPPGADREAVASLPLEGLPLDEATCRTLRRLGLRTARELAALPRSALGSRLGASALTILPLLEGDDRAPLTPYTPKKAPAETVELEYGTDSLEALGFVAKTLTTRLASRLEGRGIGVTKLTLVLELDARARLDAEARETSSASSSATATSTSTGPRPKRTRRSLTVTMPMPVVSPKEMLVILRTRLERTRLEAPVLALTLRADEHAPRVEVPQSLFEPESRESRAIPLLVAELLAELGEGKVGKLALGDSWNPAERSVLVPFFAKPKSLPPHDVGPSLSEQASPEPSVLLPEPMPVARSLVRPFRFVARYESLAWWREPSGQSTKRDVLAATLEGRAAIVDVDKTNGAARVLGWLD